jgi:hypothetical protein
LKWAALKWHAGLLLQIPTQARLYFAAEFTHPKIVIAAK